MAENDLIAIVDDDAPLLAALGNLMRSAGYRVVLFESAEACLAGATREIDLLLTDFRMTGATGVELIQRLRMRGCTAAAIVMTAHTYDEVAGLAVAAGTDAVLSKPFDEDDLLDVIEAALRDAAAPRPGAAR